MMHYEGAGAVQSLGYVNVRDSQKAYPSVRSDLRPTREIPCAGLHAAKGNKLEANLRAKRLSG